ncbi:MAG: DNA methyltransferase [Pseudomonadota bacterium]
MTQKTDPTTLLLYELEIKLQSIKRLTPYKNNARTHSKRQIQQLVESIKTFGFISPVLVDAVGGIVAGHGRIEAAKLLGMKEVPTIRLDHLTPEELRAYILADNRLAELAGWDKEILAIEFQELQSLDLGIDLTTTGFEIPEIDLLIQGLAPEPDPLDEAPEVDENVPVISRTGDLWVLGEHTLACTDALIEASFLRLMANLQSSMVITDPPYNVPIDGHVSGLGAVKHDDFAMACGEMSDDQFTQFLATAFTLLGRYSLPGSLHYIFMDWRHMGELLTAGNTIYDSLKNVCVWNKNNGGMGSLYRSKHELVFVFKKGSEPHINNVQLGRYGRYRTNVWDYPGVNSFGGSRMDELRMHPTVKPVALIADAMLDASNPGDLILDAFGGSGTTIIAAEQVGRQARVIEIDPRYVDVTIRRWEQVTGGTAIHANTGLSFDDIANQRLSTCTSAISSTTTHEVTTDV